MTRDKIAARRVDDYTWHKSVRLSKSNARLPVRLPAMQHIPYRARAQHIKPYRDTREHLSMPVCELPQTQTLIN